MTDKVNSGLKQGKKGFQHAYHYLDDDQFNDEKAFLIKQIQELQPIQD